MLRPQTELAFSARRLPTDLLLLAGFCAGFFFFGLGNIGLSGADEPRYAQIAREMLARRDWVTPVFLGRPWLEKPILYYWEAMFSYGIFGVHDWAARLPGAVNASMLVVAVYFFVRRFFRGGELDAGLMLATTVFMIAFGHAASTDMPLTAAFTMGMLAWTVWHCGRGRVWLYLFYLFMALGTLAKGPVAPLLAGIILVLFAGVRRRAALIRRTLSPGGILLYAAVAAPWYFLVQRRTGNFLRVFLLEHNLERFHTPVYHHQQPLWYFAPVLLAALAPWTVLAIAGFIRAVRWQQPRERIQNPTQADILLLLALWGAAPVVFFSFSASKLPGYILPSAPPFAVLGALWLRHMLTASGGKARLVAFLHALAAGAPLAAALLVPYALLRLFPPRAAIETAAAAGAIAFGGVYLVTRFWGLRTLRLVTLFPVVVGLGFLLRVAAPALDSRLTARPVARELIRLAPSGLPVAACGIDRELEYGLDFYLDQPVAIYERSESPSAAAYVLVVHHALPAYAQAVAPGRRFTRLADFPAQDLVFYWVTRLE